MITIAQSFKLRLDRLPRKQLIAEMRRLEAVIKAGEAAPGMVARYQRVRAALR